MRVALKFYRKKEALLIKRRGFTKIFPGWWLVFSGGIIAFWQQGYQSFGLSALFKPLSAELGFSRAATSVAASIGSLEGGLEAPVVGWITDKFGPRWLILGGIFFFGLSLILMNFIQSLWAFYLIWGVMLGTASNMTTTISLRTAISNWFVKKRGLAQSTQMTMASLSGVLVLPLIAWMLITQGWRMTCLIGGVIMWLVGLPLAWFFVKQRRPEYYGLLPDGASAEEKTADINQMVERGVKYAAEVEEVEFTLKQALRTPTFWLLILAQANRSVGGLAFNLHAIPFLTDRGVEPLVAAGMLSLRVLVSLPGKFIGGLIADRVSKRSMRFIMGAGFVVEGIGTAIFLLHPTLAMIYVWFILYGLGQGIGGAINSPMMGRYFGRKAFGSITGLSTALAAPTSIAAPIYFGWVYDTTGSYMIAFTLLAVGVGVSGILVALIPPPKPPAEITDVRKFV